MVDDCTRECLALILSALQAPQRLVRQEQITEEIIESPLANSQQISND